MLSRHIICNGVFGSPFFYIRAVSIGWLSSIVPDRQYISYRSISRWGDSRRAYLRNNRGKPPNRYCPDVEERRSKYPIANYVSTQHLSNPIHAFIKTLLSCHIPKNVEETLADPKWALAIQEEMEALQNNNSWRLIPLPKVKKILGCKWVFSIKYKSDGSIDRHKARLVAKGFT